MDEMAIPALDAQTLHSMRAPDMDATRRKLAALNLSPGADGEVGVDQALEEFQNLLVKEMVKAMRASVMKSELFEDNTGREIFESLLDEKYAESFARQGGSLGLTEALKIQLGLTDAEIFDKPKSLTKPSGPVGPALPTVPRRAPALPVVSELGPALPIIQMKGDSHSLDT